ncbi:MAG: fibronectin type III domain-containing protein [Deltaproteobacteria bacterium]|nr:fibronectin type III domain-containing protein [Deltaproteobacteria bacterium]
MKKVGKRWSVVALGFLMFLAGCGVRGPIRPPLRQLPASASHVSARQIGGTVLISWNLPKTREDGAPLTDLRGFDLYRDSFAPDAGCVECAASDLPLRDVDLEYLEGVMREDDRLTFKDRPPVADTGYRYRIVSVAASGRSDAASVDLVFVAAPPVPANLTVEHRTEGLRVHWTPLTERQRTADFVGYNIYRRRVGEAVPSTPINDVVCLDSAFMDRNISAGEYVYTVRSVWRVNNQRVESADSTDVVSSF